MHLRTLSIFLACLNIYTKVTPHCTNTGVSAITQTHPEDFVPSDMVNTSFNKVAEEPLHVLLVFLYPYLLPV